MRRVCGSVRCDEGPTRWPCRPAPRNLLRARSGPNVSVSRSFSCTSFARGWRSAGAARDRSDAPRALVRDATKSDPRLRYSAPSPSSPPPKASSARAGSTSPTADAPAPPPPPRARPAPRTAAAPASSRSSTAPAPNPTAPTLSPRSQLASARGPTVDGSRARFGVPRRLRRSFHAGLRVETMERAK